MNTGSLPITRIEANRQTLPALTSAVRSFLLLFCLLFPLRFMELILHEGGHALVKLLSGKAVTLFYVHPFALNGYVRPVFNWNNVWTHASGAVVVLLVSLLIFIPLWKRRSVANLPFVMLFPWVAIMQGLYIFMVQGDFHNIMGLTRVPAIAFRVIGALIFGVGAFFFISLFPLLGLAPQDRKSLIVIPASYSLWTVVGVIVTYLCVPGSPGDVRYHLSNEILAFGSNVRAALFNGVLTAVIFAVLFAVIYLTLYRWMCRRLPASLRTEKVNITWQDLRNPGLLFTISVIVGLMIIR
jgi:hypothetical protein